jgi:hypothetical protein
LAQTSDLTKQGFSRFSLKPGEEVAVTGVLAAGGRQLGEFTAARADQITAGGRTLFSRGAYRD